MSDLGRNLRFLCLERGTIAETCRDLGVNQQQFSKWISGRARPSPRSLRRLSQHFEISEDALERSHASFVVAHRRRGLTQHGDPLRDAFYGSVRELRPFLGRYQTYYRSPALPDHIAVGAVFLDEYGGVVRTRSLEGLRLGVSPRRQWSRSDGQAAMRGRRIFVLERERGADGALSMTTLVPPHRYSNGLLFGVVSFVASSRDKAPTASAVVWERVANATAVISTIRRTGAHPMSSLRINAAARNYLQTPVQDGTGATTTGSD